MSTVATETYTVPIADVVPMAAAIEDWGGRITPYGLDTAAQTLTLAVEWDEAAS